MTDWQPPMPEAPRPGMIQPSPWVSFWTGACCWTVLVTFCVLILHWLGVL